MPKPKILTIIGPTASGKTDFAFQTAGLLKKKFNKEIEIISADSRQVYKHISVASAQPPEEYLEKIKHYFIDELELDEGFNAGQFGKEGRDIIGKIFSAGKIPLIVGGSGLYINSLVYGLFEIGDITDEQHGNEKQHGHERQKEIRKILNKKLAGKGINTLFDELKKADPVTAGTMEHVTARRVMRALEVYYLTGIPLSALQNNKAEINFEPVLIGLDWEREELYKRINKRTDMMIEKGLVEEIEALKEKGYNYKEYNSLNTVGVKEVFDYLEGKTDYNRMIELIKQNTRRFAKRQMSWFRRDKNIKWLNANSYLF
jgi:tRNA dimethylallyltransferase